MNDTILYDDLCYTLEHIFEYSGSPFTGVAVQYDEDGRAVCRVSFLNGLEHGTAKDYFPSGAIKNEIPYTDGVINGVKREWYENGNLKVASRVVFGMLMESEEYAEDGSLVKRFVRDAKDSLPKILDARDERIG